MCALLAALDAGRACSPACAFRLFVAYSIATEEEVYQADIKPVLLDHAML